MADADDWAVQTEARLLDAALPLATELGWTTRLVARAAAAVGMTGPEAELLLPGGARDLAALLSRRDDEAALEALAGVDPATLRIRDRIRRAVLARIEAAMTHEGATRRVIGFLALPQNLALGARLAWASADGLWRWAGDTATDENHYSKRAILAALLGSTLSVRLTGSLGAAEQHLDHGVEAVMTYEKAKARFKTGDVAADIAAALARLRFGATPA